jgi:hypothetical protein
LIDALDRRDAAEAAATIETEEDPARVLAMYHGAIRHLYWANKDVATIVELGGSAMAYGEQHTDAALLGLLKAICYDLGSFCWPGWAEAGIEIDDDTLAFGRQAAERNSALAESPDVPALGKASAQWLIGAHRLAADERDHAVRAFEACATQAHLAKERGLELLATNYARIARSEPLDLEAFAGLEDADELIAQLEAAQRVFDRS